MIELETLSKCKGSDKFGSCYSCGAYESKENISRIRITNSNGCVTQSNSVCLCDDCAIKLRDLLNYIEISNLIKRGGAE